MTATLPNFSPFYLVNCIWGDWKDVGELHPSPHVVAVAANLLARLLINTDSTDPDSDSSCRDCCRILNHCSFQQLPGKKLRYKFSCFVI